ncbi:MAG: hypothetical protein SX243_20720 [Acidobacteriota bacterium]|nr:hypothetical protein [Acidobacteriota bacterium]
MNNQTRLAEDETTPRLELRTVPVLLICLIFVAMPADAAASRVEQCLTVAAEVGADLDAEVDLRHRDAGLIAFASGVDEVPLLGQDPTDSYLAYEFVDEEGDLRFRTAYFVGKLSMVGAMRGRRGPERGRAIHQELMARLRRAGLRPKELEDETISPDHELLRYGEELREGGVVAETETVLMPVAARGGGDSSFRFTGDANDEAAAQLGRFLKAQGMEVHSIEGNIVGVKHDGLFVGLQPRTTEDGLDRLVATISFHLREGARADEVADVVAKLNREAVGIDYSALDGGILVQFLVTFVDQLELAEIEAAIAMLRDLRLVTLVIAPELAGLLAR